MTSKTELDPGAKRTMEGMWYRQARQELDRRLSAAEMLKDEGNDKFSEGEYADALEEYEYALQLFAYEMANLCRDQQVRCGDFGLHGLTGHTLPSTRCGTVLPHIPYHNAPCPSPLTPSYPSPHHLTTSPPLTSPPLISHLTTSHLSTSHLSSHQAAELGDHKRGLGSDDLPKIQKVRVPCLLNSAACHIKLGSKADLTKALGCCAEVLQAAPPAAQRAKAHFRVGQAHFALENYREAWTSLVQAQEMNPSSRVSARCLPPALVHGAPPCRPLRTAPSPWAIPCIGGACTQHALSEKLARSRRKAQS